jgi:hypothetical protein
VPERVSRGAGLAVEGAPYSYVQEGAPLTAIRGGPKLPVCQILSGAGYRLRKKGKTPLRTTCSVSSCLSGSGEDVWMQRHPTK